MRSLYFGRKRDDNFLILGILVKRWEFRIEFYKDPSFSQKEVELCFEQRAESQRFSFLFFVKGRSKYERSKLEDMKEES